MNGLLKSKTLTLFTLQFFLFSILPIPSAHAGEFRVFGPKSYIRDTSSPDTITDTFQVLNPNTAYTLRLTNGSLQDSTTEKVSSSIITLNGTEVVTPQDFNQNVSSLTVPVQLLSSNALSVELRSKPGGTLHGEIVGIDNELPVLQILTPQHGQVLDTDTMEVQINLSDGISGINPQSFHVTLNGVDKTSFFTLPSPTLSSSVTGTLTLPEGQNALIASIQDQAGNATQASVTFTVLLTPPVTPASGFIHGEVFDALSGAPLEGAVISVRGIQGIVRTAPDGRFSFPTPGTGEFLLMIEKENYTVAQRRVNVVGTRDASVDPAFLTPLDPHTTVVGPQGGTATTSDGSVSLVIPPGALAENVPIRMTSITSSKRLPSPFPEGASFAHALDIQPEVTLSQPALLRIANMPGFAPGTPIPIALYNMETLVWENFGMATVSSDGAFVEIFINHFSHYGCPLPAPPPQGRKPSGPDGRNSAPENLTTDVKDRGRGCSLSVGSEVGLRDGALRVDYSLPSVRRLDQSQPLTLVYASDTVKPDPLIDTETLIDPSSVPGGEPGTLVPITAGFKVLVEGIQKEVKFQGTQGSATQRYLWDGKNGRGEIVPSGSYPYTVELTHDYQANFFTSNGVGGE
ncbi:MAG: carboxypeptidase regulatory-like domain-containing protein, partial [Candidatus Omnitrophica bacterium]|nr:carboxypeptidase regulatory-like domain-containing protein [Candidatus Omnitrophota bacterium]